MKLPQKTVDALVVLVTGAALVAAVVMKQNEVVLKALETAAEMEVITETTTQTVEGDSATINNGEWEQYNDNATNGGGN